jgi:hypothetical protein
MGSRAGLPAGQGAVGVPGQPDCREVSVSMNGTMTRGSGSAATATNCGSSTNGGSCATVRRASTTGRSLGPIASSSDPLPALGQQTTAASRALSNAHYSPPRNIPSHNGYASMQRVRRHFHSSKSLSGVSRRSRSSGDTMPNSWRGVVAGLVSHHGSIGTCDSSWHASPCHPAGKSQTADVLR